MSARSHTLNSATVQLVSALPRSRTVLLTQRERVAVGAEARGRTVNVIAGARGAKGDSGDCPLVIGPIDDAPVTQPRIWLKTTDTPGDVAVILRMP